MRLLLLQKKLVDRQELHSNRSHGFACERAFRRVRSPMRQKGSSWETRPFHASAPGWVFFVRCIASMHLDWLGNSKSGGYSTLLCGEIGVILKHNSAVSLTSSSPCSSPFLHVAGASQKESRNDAKLSPEAFLRLGLLSGSPAPSPNHKSHDASAIIIHQSNDGNIIEAPHDACRPNVLHHRSRKLGKARAFSYVLQVRGLERKGVAWRRN